MVSLNKTISNGAQPNLLIPEIVLVSAGQPMLPPKNMVYSTAPQFALDASAKKYCIKGGDNVEIALAELIAHILADLVGLPVPRYAVGRDHRAATPHFCSEILEDAIRNVEPYLKRKKISNPDSLSKVILLDVWLANDDRNIGNLLGVLNESANDGTISLVAIDFEKSKAIRSRAPRIEIPGLQPKALWPRGVLDELCAGYAKLQDSHIQSFQAITPAQLEDAVSSSFATLGLNDETRKEIIVDALLHRQKLLADLAKSEWN